MAGKAALYQTCPGPGPKGSATPQGDQRPVPGHLVLLASSPVDFGQATLMSPVAGEFSSWKESREVHWLTDKEANLLL